MGRFLLVGLVLGSSLAYGQVVTMPGGFSVNESGAATYSIPIHVPPGTGGMGPTLALAYSSQSGNGLPGLGWSLAGLSGVARCPRTQAQDAVRGSVNFDLNDRYCLDGQRLIAINGADGANGTEYRTEREGFAKIVSYGSAGVGPAYFVVQTKAGLTLQYGNSGDSRIEAKGKSSAMIWAVNKVSDVKGNYYTVTYTEDTPKGAFYPARIDYTGNAGIGMATGNSIVFTYEDRTDTGDFYVAGSFVSLPKRLTKISTFNGATPVSDYVLAYTQTVPGSSSRLVSVKRCVGGSVSVCLEPSTFTWQTNTAAAVSFGAPLNWGSFGLALAAGDVNGDGYSDVVLASQSGLPTAITMALKLSNGTTFGGAISLGTARVDGDGVLKPFALADINGDGKADLVWADGVVRLSVGNGFGPEQSWGSGGTVLALGDVDGDGKADLVYALAPTMFQPQWQMKLKFSTGTAFGPAINLGAAHADEYGLISFSLGETNGDGRSDLIWADGGVQKSTGSGFGSGEWLNFAGAMAVGDVNGDGNSDLIAPLFGNLGVVLSNGLSANGTPVNVGAGRGERFVLADVNGDGRADIVWADGMVQLASIADSERITKIYPGGGGSISLTYGKFSDTTLYAAATGSVWPIRDFLPQTPLMLVKQVVNSGGNSLATSTYRYGAGKYEVGTGRGAFGFAWIESTQLESGVVTRSEYRQDWPYVGLAKRNTVSLSGAGNGGLLKESTNTFACLDPASTAGASCVIGAGKRYFPYASQSIEKSWDLNGAALPVITTSTAYDCGTPPYACYGNVTSVTVSNSDGSSKTNTNTYSNDEANWRLGRLLRSTVTSVTP